MTATRFWQLAFALPIVFPFASWSIWRAAVRGQDTLPGDVIGIIVSGHTEVTLLYALFVGLVLWRFRGRPADSYHRFSLFAPLVFAAIIFLAFSILILANLPVDNMRWSLLIAGLYAAVAVPTGYICVGLAHAIHWLLTRNELILQDSAA